MSFQLERDERIAGIVANWARGATSERANALGLQADASFEAIIEQPAPKQALFAQLEAIAPDAIGAPVTTLESGRTIVNAFIRAGLLSLAAMILLLAFALRLAVEFAQRVGLYAVVVDAKHDKAKAFYTKLGFIVCMDSPLALYLPVATLEHAGGI